MIPEALTSWRRIRLIARSAAVLLVVRLGLRVARLPQVLRWLHRDVVPRQQDLPTLTELAYYTDRWLALFPANPNGNCLPRAVALYRLARAYGFPVRFQCGVQRQGTQLGGHAWLLMEDRALLESTNQWAQFAVTFSFPPDGAAGREAIASIGRPDSFLSA